MHRTAAVLVALAAIHCSKPSANESWTLRTYEVANARHLRNALDSVFSMEDKSKALGKVNISPDGSLIVLAPESIHQGVKSLVDDFSKRPIPLQASLPDMTYWMVIGTTDTNAPAPGPELAPIASALAEIQKSQGPMKFVLSNRLGS